MEGVPKSVVLVCRWSLAAVLAIAVWDSATGTASYYDDSLLRAYAEKGVSSDEPRH